MKNIKVVGYYGHYNLGDEQYKITFKKLFQNYDFVNSIEFIDCDALVNAKIEDDDIIVLGGGDILNNYFIDKVIAKFYDKSNKIIAVSVGLPYIEILTNNTKLSIIDYIFIRSYQDLPLFSKYFDPHRIQYIPDLAYFLLNSRPNKRVFKNKKVAISFSRSIYGSENNTNYSSIVSSLVYFCRYLLARNFQLTFFSFNTNTLNSNENDMILHKEIIEELRLITPRNLMTNTRHIVERNPETVFNEWGNYDYAISMKFHACMFSIYNNVPFLPVYTTRKIDNLVKDIDYKIFYNLPRDSQDIPIEIKLDTLVNKFMELEKTVELTKESLYQYNQNFVSKNMNLSIEKLQEILLNPSRRQFEMCTVPYKIKHTYEKVMTFIQKQYNALKTLEQIKDPVLQETIVKLVSYNLCNTTDSKYNWGLQEKMFLPGYNYTEEWKWILEDQNKIIPNNPYGLFNLTFIDQEDYARVHRSGWQYVYENITYLHNSNASLLLDLYLDKTFGWNSEINNILGIIPYVSNWVGFIHHTFDTSFSHNNVYTLLDNPLFIISLKYCKGLFVLSEYLKTQLERELSKIGLKVNIYYLPHPVEDVPMKFDYKSFLANDERSVINVGGWLRNLYNYYSISFPRLLIEPKCLFGKKEYLLYKKAIKGKLMNNYYPESDFLPKLNLLLSTPPGNPAGNSAGDSGNCSANCSSGIPHSSANCSADSAFIKNNWYNHFYRDVVNKVNSVQIIDCLSNEEYDEMLSKNIVFLNLVDASAVNTVLECIIRNTPIIVNKIPAIVELLGESYPLYYTSPNYIEISNELTKILTAKNIKRAHTYLTRLNKHNLTIQYFINKFTGIIRSI